MADHNELGKKGEMFAEDFLKSAGYKIRGKNWQRGKLELDLIAEKGSLLIFAEVKTRTAPVEDISDVMSKAKETNLIHSVNAYMDEIEEDTECRIDLVIVEITGDKPTITHIENAISQK